MWLESGSNVLWVYLEPDLNINQIIFKCIFIFFWNKTHHAVDKISPCHERDFETSKWVQLVQIVQIKCLYMVPSFRDKHMATGRINQVRNGGHLKWTWSGSEEDLKWLWGVPEISLRSTWIETEVYLIWDWGGLEFRLRWTWSETQVYMKWLWGRLEMRLGKRLK